VIKRPYPTIPPINHNASAEQDDPNVVRVNAVLRRTGRQNGQCINGSATVILAKKAVVPIRAKTQRCRTATRAGDVDLLSLRVIEGYGGLYERPRAYGYSDRDARLDECVIKRIVGRADRGEVSARTGDGDRQIACYAAVDYVWVSPNIGSHYALREGWLVSSRDEMIFMPQSYV